MRKSIALDGEYGRAHALLAWALAQDIVYFWSADPEQDREYALRAVEAASMCIDDDPTAMAAIGAALSQCGDRDRAAAWLKRALSLDPNNAWAWGRYGHVALYSNDPDEGKKRFQRSLDLSPNDPFAFNMRMGIAQALGMEGAYHEAIVMARDVLNEYPSVTWINRTLASYHALTGEIGSAQFALRELNIATPNFSVQAMKHAHPMRHIPRYYDKLVEGLERAGQRTAHQHLRHEAGPNQRLGTRDAAELAKTRGVPAARLHAMKEDIRRNLSRPTLSVQTIAARHGVTVRYVQKLFEQTGSTFTRFVLEQRLGAAYKALTDRAGSHVSISTVAYDCGFTDLSNFNNAFRRRFGCTPTDVRAVARARSDAARAG